MACFVPSPVTRSWSGWSLRAEPPRPRRRCMYCVSSLSMSGGSECQQSVSCGRFCISMGRSCTISTLTLSRKQPSSRRFAKDFWGLTPTGICGPISSPWSLLPRRWGKESLHGGAGRWLHPPVEAGVCATVHPHHPCVFEQRVAAPVVLPPERRWEAPVVFSTSGDCSRQQLALWGPMQETEESLAPSRGLAGAARRRAHHRGGGCRHPSPEGAPLDGATTAAFGDDAGGRLGGFADVHGPPSHR
jgi:hypothetical protein